MNSGMNSPGAAAASCSMKYSGGYESRMYDHGGAMIVINFFIPPLSFMLLLAAAAPALSMPLFMLLLNMILLKILEIKKIIILRIVIKVIIVNVATSPQKLRLNQLLRR